MPSAASSPGGSRATRAGTSELATGDSVARLPPQTLDAVGGGEQRAIPTHRRRRVRGSGAFGPAGPAPDRRRAAGRTVVPTSSSGDGPRRPAGRLHEDAREYPSIVISSDVALSPCAFVDAAGRARVAIRLGRASAGIAPASMSEASPRARRATRAYPRSRRAVTGALIRKRIRTTRPPSLTTCAV